MAKSQTEQTDNQLQSLRRLREDATKALEWLDDPRYERIFEIYNKYLEEYESQLHNITLSPDVRDRFCFAVYVAKRFIGIRQHFESIKKETDIRLAEEASNKQSSEKIWNRILTFVR